MGPGFKFVISRPVRQALLGLAPIRSQVLQSLLRLAQQALLGLSNEELPMLKFISGKKKVIHQMKKLGFRL